jgi:hypothetical protein
MGLNELFESMNGGKDVDTSVADGETFTAAFVMCFAQNAVKRVDGIKFEELIKYLDDLDNLIDTGWFPEDIVSDCVFYHKELTLRNFIQNGRKYLGEYLMLINISE